jgi:hypothetical protein
MNLDVFITRLPLALVAAAPIRAKAQQADRVARLGYLALGNLASVASVIRVEALRAGLRDLGYVEGKNLVIEFRCAARWRSCTTVPLIWSV